MGGLIAERWTPVLSNLVSSFETRVVYDLFSQQPGTGIFYMAVAGNQLDNFDVLYASGAVEHTRHRNYPVGLPATAI